MFVHELVHAYQDAQGYMRDEPLVDSRKNYNGYLLSRIEREANWWANEYMKEVHGREIGVSQTYRDLGAEEFL